MSNTGNLQRLRRAAGYRTARDFAEAVGIPVSTYSRYERGGAGEDCGIPMANACIIAEALGCTIDEIVGRTKEDLSPDEALIARIRSLSDLGQGMLIDYLSYLEHREKSDA